MVVARGFQEFEGLDPRTGDTGVFRIEMSRLDGIARYHQGEKLNDLFCVNEICRKPDAAFEGIRELDAAFGDPSQFAEIPDRYGICLVGVPAKRSTSRGIVPPPKGFTFAVVADCKLLVWNWFWWPVDTGSPHLPENWQTRFDHQIWPKS